MLKPVLYAFTALAVGITPMPATAAAYLCVEDATTGFDWEGGKWVQKNFVTGQLLIRRHEADDPLASTCSFLMDAEGLNRPLAPGQVQLYKYGCYSRSEVGKEPMYPRPCKVWARSDGSVQTVECSLDIAPYTFEPNGEYVSSFTYSAVGFGGVEAEQRDSVAVTVGRCSVVTD